MNEKEIPQIIKNILASKGMNSKDLSEKINSNYRTFMHYMNGTRKFSWGLIRDISEALEVSPMVFFEEEKEPTHNDNYVYVGHYDVEASAGYGRTVIEEDVKGELAFSKEWIETRGLEPEELSVVAVAGDSMTPILNDSDLILIDHTKTLPETGKPFVIRIEDELLVKFLQKTPQGVAANSANPIYQPILLSEDNSEIVGRVVCSMREW